VGAALQSTGSPAERCGAASGFGSPTFFQSGAERSGQRPSLVRRRGSPTRKARPAPVFGPLYQRGAQGVSLDLAEHLVVVFVFLDGKRLDSTLIDMPVAHAVAMMLPLLGMRVAKPLHEGGKVIVAHLPEQKVPMVGHQ
jgi:hypothetical protein